MAKNISIANGRALPISTKQSVEICNFIRGKSTEEGKKLLTGVIEGKIAVPFRRFNKGTGHRRGKVGSGRFPKNASEHILSLLKSVETNAKKNGLVTPLIIAEIIANKGSRNWHYGRIRRIKNKRTHISITVKESTKKKLEAKIEKKTIPKKEKKEAKK